MILPKAWLLAIKAARFVGRRLLHGGAWLRDQWCCTYIPLASVPPGGLAQHFPKPPLAQLEVEREQVLALAELASAHTFDLLGSGWVQVRPGMTCRGLEGWRYTMPDHPINAANRTEAARIQALIDPGYVPIDWHIDFKSGYRWPKNRWYLLIRYGHLPGADVKVPWELARMQHLPGLALAYALTNEPHYVREFRNQLSDFIAANPPRFGVNWYSAMDVGIRIVNWLVAFDLFRAYGAVFDPDFERELKRSVYQHGQHLRANLEWRGGWRGNHYLAAVAGLLFVAAYLPHSAETEHWRAFATRELIHETTLQFNADGTNFEGSTAYHRLSAEIVTYATALALRLDARAIPADHLERLAKMAVFTAHITKTNGHVPQIGDTDNGRFLKLWPVYHRLTVGQAKARYTNLSGYMEWPDDAAYWDEDHLDHRHLITAIQQLLVKQGFQSLPAAYPPRLNLQKQQKQKATLYLFQHYVFDFPGGDLRDGMQRYAYPDFGLYLWRSRRLYLAVRCGAIGQKGNGGHAHNDQLALELTVDGLDQIVDPGTYLYTPLPKRRNEYRSAHSHFVPRLSDAEPGRLDLGLFHLGNEAQAVCLAFEDDRFTGRHDGYQAAYRTAVCRMIYIEANRLIIEDFTENEQVKPPDLSEASPIPFSPGYGIRLSS